MARITPPLCQVIGLDCQSMPTSHAANGTVSVGAKRGARSMRSWRHGITPGRSAGHATLGRTRSIEAKAQKFNTVLSDLVHAEVIGLAKNRTEESSPGG